MIHIPLRLQLLLSLASSGIDLKDNKDTVEVEITKTVDTIQRQFQHTFSLVNTFKDEFESKFKRELKTLVQKSKREINKIKNENNRLKQKLKTLQNIKKIRARRWKNNRCPKLNVEFICNQNKKFNEWILGSRGLLSNNNKVYDSIDKFQKEVENILKWVDSFEKEFRTAFKELRAIVKVAREEINKLRVENIRLKNIFRKWKN